MYFRKLSRTILFYFLLLLICYFYSRALANSSSNVEIAKLDLDSLSDNIYSPFLKQEELGKVSDINQNSDIGEKNFYFLKANEIRFFQDENFLYANGNVLVKTRDDYLIRANNIIYDLDNSYIWSQGRIIADDLVGNIILGSSLFSKDNFETIILKDYVMKLSNHAILAANIVHKKHEKTKLHYCIFTSCKITDDQEPIWQIRSKKTTLDFKKEKITHKYSVFQIKNIPILFLPYVTHSTPKAHAKSGLLFPTFSNNRINLPLYSRLRSNFDVTFTPVFSRKNQILEFEARYLNSLDQYYLLKTYYTKKDNYITQDNKVRNLNTHRYYFELDVKPNKKNCNYDYGLEVREVSDNAFLRNYYNRLDNSLNSNLFWEKVNNHNYITLKGSIFTDLLKEQKIEDTRLFVLPIIKTKNILLETDDLSSNIIIESETLLYSEKQTQQRLGRSHIKLSFNKDMVINGGILANLLLSTREDMYFIDKAHSNNKISDSNLLHSNEKKIHNKILARSIPEANLTVSYPLIGNILNWSLIINPIFSLTIAREMRDIDKKIGFIDSKQYEISENNIFSNNYYKCIDYHLFGNRGSYGVNINFGKDNYLYSILIGKTLSIKKTTQTQADLVGKFSINTDNIGLFYRFRKKQNFSSVFDEVNFTYSYRNFNFLSSFVSLNNIGKYFAEYVGYGYNKSLRQFFFKIDYGLTEHWTLGYNIVFNFKKNKFDPLSRGFEITYFNDCIKLVGRVMFNYTKDPSRGILKNMSTGFFIGLKLLNM